MRQTHRKVIYFPLTNVDAEMAQRLAFTLNYGWLNHTNKSNVYQNFQPGWGLLFDPVALTIETARPLNSYQTVTGLTDLLDALKNPTPTYETVDAGNGIHNATIFEDDVTFRSTKSRLVGTVTVPKDFLLKVAGQVAPRNLPLVCFHYPDSAQPYSTLNRSVRVTKMDADYIWGLEVVRGGMKHKEPLLKKYVRSKIRDGMELLEFVQE